MPKHHQEAHYGRDYDYWAESPHLKHRHLYELLMGRVAGLISGLPASDDLPEVLEIGAGDGAVTERLLALGCAVTGTEMSQHSVETMNERFGSNDRFRAVHDPDGTLEALEGKRFDLIVFASVLHHIPDYLEAIDRAVTRHLKPGGALVSLQDPLWYSRLPKSTLRLTKIGFLSWRITQGNIARGLSTRIRRARHGLSEEAAGDAVEYHVVREGVDEEAIARLLTDRFGEVEIYSYWSSQGTIQQKAGEMVGLKNTFGVFAENRRQAQEPDQ